MNENVLSSECAACVDVCVCVVLSTSLPFHTVQVCIVVYCHPTGLITPSSPCQLPALWCLGSLSPPFLLGSTFQQHTDTHRHRNTCAYKNTPARTHTDLKIHKHIEERRGWGERGRGEGRNNKGTEGEWSTSKHLFCIKEMDLKLSKSNAEKDPSHDHWTDHVFNYTEESCESLHMFFIIWNFISCVLSSWVSTKLFRKEWEIEKKEHQWSWEHFNVAPCLIG